MAALARSHPPQSLPCRHGSLRAEAYVPPLAMRDEAFGAVTDDRGNLSVALILAWSEGQPVAAPAHQALELAARSLRLHAPIYEIVGALRTFCASERRLELGVVLARFSQGEARVELLNAGLAPVTCVLPNGRRLHQPALSAAIGEQYGDVHPYELSPLNPGSCWFLHARPRDAATHSERITEPPQSYETFAAADRRLLAELREHDHTSTVISVCSDVGLTLPRG